MPNAARRFWSGRLLSVLCGATGAGVALACLGGCNAGADAVVTLSDNFFTVAPGESFEVKVSVGVGGVVTLSLREPSPSGAPFETAIAELLPPQPDGCSDFLPLAIQSPGSCTVTIAIGPTAPPGEYEMVIRGTFSEAIDDSPPITVTVTGSEAPPATTIRDEAFDPADWTVSYDDPNADWVIDVTNPASGGNDGAYRRMEHMVQTDTATDAIWIRHVFTAKTYDPGTYPVVASISFSMDASTLNDAVSGLCYRYVIIQGETVMTVPEARPCLTPSTAWEPVPIVAQNLDGLNLNEGAEPVVFGFQLVAQSPGGVLGRSSVYGVDNFEVVILPAE